MHAVVVAKSGFRSIFLTFSYVILKIPAQSDIRLHGFNPLNLRKSQCQNKCDSFKIFNLIHLHATLEEAAKSNIG